MKKTRKIALLRVDMSKDLYPQDYEIADGVYRKPCLPVPHAPIIVRPIFDLSLIAQGRNIFFADVLDKHVAGDPEFNEWRPHCIKHLPGSNVIDGLPMSGVRTYGKQTYDGFADSFLESNLKTAGVDTVMIVGLVGDICVKATGQGAKEAGFEVVFVREAICFLPDVENNPALKEEKFKELENIGRVISLEEALALIKKSP